MNPDEEALVNYSVDPKGNIIEQVLRIACYDEYRANAYYQKVLDTFGIIKPFSNIAQAEVKHYGMIEKLCYQYNVAIPINDWYQKTEVSSTVQECCQDGVDAEIANINMYDTLLTYVKEADIRDVFYKEQAASYNNHLPAFTQCAQVNETAQAQETKVDNKDKDNGHHDIYNMVQGLLNGDTDTGKVTQLLGTFASRDMLLGLSAGAVLAMALSSDTLKEKIGDLFNNDESPQE